MNPNFVLENSEPLPPGQEIKRTLKKFQRKLSGANSIGWQVNTFFFFEVAVGKVIRWKRGDLHMTPGENAHAPVVDLV